MSTRSFRFRKQNKKSNDKNDESKKKKVPPSTTTTTEIKSTIGPPELPNPAWPSKVDLVAAMYFVFKYEKLNTTCTTSEMRNSFFSPFALSFTLTTAWSMYAEDSVKEAKDIGSLLDPHSMWDQTATGLWEKRFMLDFEQWSKIPLTEGSVLALNEYVFWNRSQNGKFPEALKSRWNNKIKLVEYSDGGEDDGSTFLRSQIRQINDHASAITKRDFEQIVSEDEILYQKSSSTTTKSENENENTAANNSIVLVSYLYLRIADSGWFTRDMLTSGKFQLADAVDDHDTIDLQMLHNPLLSAYYYELNETTELSTRKWDIQLNKEVETVTKSRIKMKLLELANPSTASRFRVGFILPSKSQNFCDFFRVFVENGGVNYYAGLIKSDSWTKVDVKIPVIDMHFHYNNLVPFVKFSGVATPFSATKSKFYQTQTEIIPASQSTSSTTTVTVTTVTTTTTTTATTTTTTAPARTSPYITKIIQEVSFSLHPDQESSKSETTTTTTTTSEQQDKDKKKKSEKEKKSETDKTTKEKKKKGVRGHREKKKEKKKSKKTGKEKEEEEGSSTSTKKKKKQSRPQFWVTRPCIIYVRDRKTEEILGEGFYVGRPSAQDKARVMTTT